MILLVIFWAIAIRIQDPLIKNLENENNNNKPDSSKTVTEKDKTNNEANLNKNEVGQKIEPNIEQNSKPEKTTVQIQFILLRLLSDQLNADIVF